MGVFIFFVVEGVLYMNTYHINKYLYISRGSHSKFEIYARTIEFADSLADRITSLGVFNLRRAKIHFCTPTITEIPPYEMEQEQLKTIEEWEKKKSSK